MRTVRKSLRLAGISVALAVMLSLSPALILAAVTLYALVELSRIDHDSV